MSIVERLRRLFGYPPRDVWLREQLHRDFMNVR